MHYSYQEPCDTYNVLIPQLFPKFKAGGGFCSLQRLGKQIDVAFVDVWIYLGPKQGGQK
jgi:hypothetical protein